MPFKPVDAAIKVVVGPAIDDTDFKSREETLAFNQAGMEVDVILEKHDGTIVTTAVTPTAAGDYDWAHTDQGYYELELPASGGASFNNTEEGMITVLVYCTGVLPFGSISYDVVPTLVYDSLVKGTDNLQVDAIQISGDATAANNAELAFDGTGYGFTGCTMPIVSALTGHTAQTGDSFARIGAPIAASISADLVVIDNFVDNLESRLTAARAGYLDNLSAGAVALANEYDGDLEDIRTLLGDGGDVFYVSKTGDNSDGTTWAKAKNTIDSAIALCTADHCDRIYIGCGVYDETSATAGVVCDVAGIKIIGAMPGVAVKNTNTTNGSKVFYITANNVWLHNVKVEKGETTSDNAICIDVDGAYISADIRDVTIAVEKATHTGIRFTGGAVGSGYVNGPMAMSYIYSAAGVGTGIEAANCNNCVAIAAQFHTLTTGIKFTGGANCHDNMVSPYAMISSCTTGISLNAGCTNNMLSALILNCTSEYDDNSGNNTNKADGSLTYVLDDIKTHVNNGFDSVEGAGFDTLTDSLEAIRNRGDAAWTTATTVALSAAAIDAILDEIIGDAVHATPNSVGAMLHAVYCRFMQKRTATNTEEKAYKLDDITELKAFTLDDVGGMSSRT